MKLVDQFIYRCSNISSIERVVNITIGKRWTDIDRLMTIQKSDLFDKIKREFFQAVAMSALIGTETETLGEKATWELHKDDGICFEQILKEAPNKTADLRPLTSHLTNHPSKTSQTCRALLVK